MASYANSNPALVVDHAPFFASGSLTDGNSATVTFDNLTEQIIVSCGTAGAGGVLRVGVTAAGVASTENIGLITAMTTGALDVRLKQLVIKADGATCTYQVFAVLSRLASGTYPDITTANGFAGV